MRVMKILLAAPLVFYSIKGNKGTIISGKNNRFINLMDSTIMFFSFLDRPLPPILLYGMDCN